MNRARAAASALKAVLADARASRGFLVTHAAERALPDRLHRLERRSSASAPSRAS